MPTHPSQKTDHIGESPEKELAPENILDFDLGKIAVSYHNPSIKSSILGQSNDFSEDSNLQRINDVRIINSPMRNNFIISRLVQPQVLSVKPWV